MPGVKIFNKTKPFTCYEITYKSGEETLSNVIEQYDSTLSLENTNLLVGDELFTHTWDIPIEVCLVYGDFISLYTHKMIIFVIYENEKIKLEMKPSDTIKDLKDDIQYQLEINFTQLELAYNGEILADDSKSLRLCALMHHSNIHVTQYKIDESNRERNAIIVQVGTAITFTLGIRNMSMLVNELKKKITEMKCVPIDQQTFIFAGKKLEDNMKLSAYNIKPFSTIHLVLRLRGGGGGFADIRHQPRRFDWSDEAPEWRTVNMGLSLEGVCKNKSCEAYKKMVIMNMGLPVIYKLGLKTLQNQTNCPMCQDHVEPITCAFNNCYYRYIARIEQKDNQTKRLKTEWIEVNNFYSRFNEKNQASYASLVIETKPLRMYQDVYNFTEPLGCIYCLRKFEEDDKELIKQVRFNRASYFHTDCKNDLENRLM